MVHPAEARAGVERGGHAGSIWSCVKGLQNGRSACAPACCITPSASAATSTFAPKYQGGQVIFTINQDLKTCRCSACGAREVRPRGRVERRFRALPIGSRVTTLVLPIPRVQCLACGVVRQVEIPFADPRGALQAEAHGQQPRSLSFKGALQTRSRLMDQTFMENPSPFRTPQEITAPSRWGCKAIRSAVTLLRVMST